MGMTRMGVVATMDRPLQEVVREKTACAARIGFWSGVVTAVLATAALVLAVTTPPRSGPFAGAGGIVYPYTEGVAAFVPRDYLWMYPAVLAAPAFLVLAASIAALAGEDRRVFGVAGLCLATVATALLAADYFIQLHVLQPMLAGGESGGLAVWTQYNPHGVFIALEELGYLVMNAAFLFLALTLRRRERALRRTLVASTLLGASAFVGLSLAFGLGLECRFECAIIVIDTGTLVAAGALWGVGARRTAR